MFQHVVDGALDAHTLPGEFLHVAGDFKPHLLAQAAFGQAHTFVVAETARSVALLVTGRQQVTHAAVGPFMPHVIVGTAVGDGELGGSAARLAWTHPLLEQGVEGGVVQCQKFFVTLVAQLAAFRFLKSVIHGKKCV